MNTIEMNLPQPLLVRFEQVFEDFEHIYQELPPFYPPPPPLVRQTNRHELLSEENRERWWNANQAERDQIMDQELPEPDDLEEIDFTQEIFEFPIIPLVRQTNRHELLSPERRVRWWAATQEERDGIMAEEGL